jgi:hypothetical protein
MFTKEFWQAALERAIRGGALVATGLWGVSAITDIDQATSVLEVTAVGFAWGAIGSFLLSLAGSQIGDKGSPSFTPVETVNQDKPDEDPGSGGPDASA